MQAGLYRYQFMAWFLSIDAVKCIPDRESRGPRDGDGRTVEKATNAAGRSLGEDAVASDMGAMAWRL